MKKSLAVQFALIAILISFPMTARSADLTWDNAGADNNWNTISANWTGASTVWTNSDSAIFGTAAETVTLTEEITAGNITFNVDDYIISTNSGNLTITSGITANGNATLSGSNEVALGADNTWETASGKTLTVSANVSSGQALVKTGAGSLILSGTNTYTGITTISAGTLILAGGNAIVDSGEVVTQNVVGALLQLDANETIGTLSGGGTDGGHIDLQGHTLTIAQTSRETFSGNISGSGGLTIAGNKRLTLAGNNTFSGKALVKNGGLLRLGSSSFNAQAELKIETGGSFELTARTDLALEKLSGGGEYIYSNNKTRTLSIGSGNSSSEFSGGLSESGTGKINLTKAGAGIFILSGVNAHTGTTTVSGGTLVLAGGSAIADTGAVITDNVAGALLQLNADEAIGTLSGGGTDGGHIDLQSHTLTIDQSSNGTFSGNVSGTGGITKAGTGTLTFASKTTYTGPTQVNGGTLTLGAEQSSVSYSINAGTLNLTNGDLLSSTTNIDITNGGSFQFANQQTIGALSGNGTINYERGGGSKTLTVTNSVDSAFSGNILQNAGGTLNLSKNGTGTLTLSGNHTYTGTTTVSAGTLLINSTTGSGTGAGAVTVNNNATLGGTGRIGAATTGGITIESGGIHTAATITTAGTQTILGDLTYDTGSSITWNLIDASLDAGTGWDLFELDGTGLSFGSNIDFNISDDVASGLSASKDFLVWSGYNSVSGITFTDGYATNFSFNYGGSAPGIGNGNFKIFQDGSNGIFLEFTAVPEPSTYALMGLGLAAFGWHARRRRHKEATTQKG